MEDVTRLSDCEPPGDIAFDSITLTEWLRITPFQQMSCCLTSTTTNLADAVTWFTIVFRFAENRRYGEPEGNVQDAQMPNRATLTEANSPRV